jgi:electron transfer flavoprotein beta subunit
MNIIVCLKQVPGTTRVKIDPQTNAITRQGIDSVMNPLDEYALEEGIRLKERFGGKVIAISMGPPQAEQMLRSAISLGVDEAILLSDQEFTDSDTLATSYTLGLAINKIKEYDLVLCGRQTLDGDTGQVGPELAQMLCIPFVAYVNKVENIAGGLLTIRRSVDDGYEIIEAVLPAVITVTKEINVPRLFSLRGMMKAKTARIPIWKAADIQAEKDLVGRAGSATVVVKTFVPEKVRRSQMIQGKAEEQVETLVGKLKETRVI